MKVRLPGAAGDSLLERKRLLDRRRQQQYWHRLLVASAWVLGLAVVLAVSALVTLSK